ncbi:MAG: flavin reductase family protein [Rhodospirillales bacterium]
MTVEPSEFRSALGLFASGVCVVTAVADAGAPVGVTISAFSSLSLEPPLILFCLGNKTRNIDAFVNGSGRFAVNILAEDQVALSERFASQAEDKFAGIACRRSEAGPPLLPGSLAQLECTRVATHVGGDHLIVVGRVERVHGTGEARPLLRFRGHYRRLDGRL